MRLMLFLKISVMVAALLGVFYSMRYLRSPEFIQKTQSPDSPVAVLLGATPLPAAAVTRWCPQPLKSLQAYSKNLEISATRPVTVLSEQEALCSVQMEPVSKEDIGETYQSVLEATPETGKPVFLERNEKGVFRVLGMPFRSQALTESLKKHEF